MQPSDFKQDTNQNVTRKTGLSWTWLWQLALTAVIYILSAKLGQTLITLPGTNIGIVWPQVGILLALALLLGYRIWPAIALASFLTNFPILLQNHPANTALLIALGQISADVLEVLLGVYLARRLAGDNPFNKIDGVLRFLLAILISQAVCASITTLSLALGKTGNGTSLAVIWWTYWVSNVVSVVVITPFILIWDKKQNWPSRKQVITHGFFYALTGLWTVFVFHLSSPNSRSYFDYFTILFVIWAAFKLGKTGAATATLVVTFITVRILSAGSNVLPANAEGEALLLLQIHLATLAVTGLILSAELEERQQSEDSLRESEQLYRSLVDVLPEGVAISDLSGNLTFASAQMLALYGCSTPEEAIGTNALQWIAPESQPKATANIQNALNNIIVIDDEYSLIKKDGTRFFGQIKGASLKNQQGQLTKIVTVHRDITERKRVEQALTESEERFRLFLEYSPIYVFFKDADTRALNLSKNYEGLLGKPLGELLGKTTDELFPPEFAKSTMEDDRKILRDGKVIEIEDELNGHFYSTVKFPVYRAGKPQFLAGFTMDITERKRYEMAARESDAKIRAYLELASVIMLALDPNEQVTLINRMGCEVLGRKEEEIIGKNWFENFLPESAREEMRAKFRQLLAGETESLEYFENAILPKTGQERTIAWHNAVLYDEKGQPSGILSSGEDITVRRHIGEALRKSEERYRNIFENAVDGIFQSLPEGRYITVNPAMARMYGYDSPQDMLACVTDIRSQIYADPDLRAEFMGCLERDGAVFDFETLNRRKDGSTFWITSNARIVRDANGETLYYEGTIADVTVRKQIEDALRESEARLRKAQTIAHVGNWEFDFKTCKKWGSEEVFRIYGIEPISAELPYDVIQAYALAEYRPRLNQAMQRFLSQQGEYDEEYRIKKGGMLEQTRYIHSKAELILDDAGRPIKALGVVQDITERKQAEESVRIVNETLRTIFNVSPLAIILIDLDGNIQMWNSAAERIFGWTEAEVLGKPNPIVSEEQRAEYQEWVNEIIQGSDIIDRETVRQRKGGSPINVSISTSLLHEAEGQPRARMAIIADITERKQIEDEIRRLNTELEQRVLERTAQLEAANKELESFSYSVSHDLRAPLRGVDGYSRILQEEYAAALPPDANRLLDSVRGSARQMGRLIDDLLKFSRLSRQPLRKQRVDTMGLVLQALKTLQHEHEERQMEIEIGDLPVCQGDPGLLLQVWINLLSNALKFTRQREVARIAIGCQVNEHGESVYFVRDNGAGFDMQYAYKLFGVFQRLHSADDFDGTGVGLALTQRIILRHGGRIWADAQPDVGATFSFTL